MGGTPSLARVQQKSGGGSKKTPTRTQANDISITHPPGSPGVSPICQKHMNATDARILALSDVSDEAMIQARDNPYGMVSTRPELLAAITGTGLRIFIFDDRTTSLPNLPEFKEWSLAEHRTGGFVVDGSGYTIAAPDGLDAAMRNVFRPVGSGRRQNLPRRPRWGWQRVFFRSPALRRPFRVCG
ncbi:MAG: hypothetical protein OXO48_19325 [Caldilineaceae bacterium]|nr:hypothetical protein [Caldilineaceae bacterium]